MNLERLIRRENDRLGRELGFVAGYLPRYKWVWSEDREMMHPMRVMTGQDSFARDFKANESGILESVPLYQLRKMCPTANQQWVLAEWLPSPSESEWRQLFGYMLEWPRDGQYYPTNVFLDPGEQPSPVLTDTVIDCVRQNRMKSARQVAEEAASAIQKREQREKQNLYEEIRDACTTYDHVPGRCDQVSYPVAPDANLRSFLQKTTNHANDNP
jgi:hypothetical protein